MKIHTTSFGLPYDERNGSHDSFMVKSWDETVLAVLADGAGTAPAAREASERAVRSFVSHYETRPPSWSPQKALAEFARVINQTLHQESLTRFGGPELVTTLSVAVIEGDRLYGLSVGDSRVYLARDARLTQLSRDHTAERTGLKHVLDRAVGLEAAVEPCVFETELCDGDAALLCSDGLSNVLDEAALLAGLHHRRTARHLVYDARDKSTPETLDDISAIVLQVEKTGKLRTVKDLPLRIPETLRRGDVIDGFTLVKSFQGSDRVWLATRDGRRYTLKFAPVEAARSEDVLNAFVKETWNATRLQEGWYFPHAFVPDPVTTRCYVMEFIEAGSLKTLLASRRLAVDEGIALGVFLLKAAQHLMSFDLVHGDIKPENILVPGGYDKIDFKLVDFGSVTEIFSVTSRAGTASYLAPERFKGAPISERTEIFAIGVTLFEGLTQAFPYGEIERFQTPRFHSPKRPGALNPNLPPWLEAVLLRATSTEPERRYQNYSEFLFDLEHPNRVAPFRAENLPLLERDPLRVYKTAFYLALATAAVLLALLLLR